MTHPAANTRVTDQPKIGMFSTVVIMLLVGLTLLGVGIDMVRLDCTPIPPAGAQSVANTLPSQLQCDYQSSRLWGIWTTQSGTVSGVQILESSRARGTKGGDIWALQLRTADRGVALSPHAAARIAPRVFEAFDTGKQSGLPFTVRSLQINDLAVLLSSGFLFLGVLFIAAFPVFLRPKKNDGLPRTWQQRWWRIGRDDSFIPLGIFGIPVWLGLVVVYILGCFAVVSMADWLPPNAAIRFAGSGPALLALIDLIRRLRTAEYYSTTSLGLEVTHHASLIDRLTFRECGWYLPVLGAPIPLWVLGGGITLIILTM